MRHIKIAFIGAGSIGFTRTLLSDILSVSELQDIEIAFTDINPRNLEMVRQLCQRDIYSNGLDITIEATLDRRIAFRDADYIVNCMRVGMLEAFTTDIEIPLKYGIDQCVGDTLCAGGIMYSQRNIGVLIEMCKDIRDVAKPNVLLLNYANPNAINTWYCNTFGGVQTVGLCHGVQSGHALIAKVLGYRPEEVDIICAGINHMTWYLSVKHHGQEMNNKLLQAFQADPEVARSEKVRIDVLKRFGYFCTESNGHLSEYLPWYRKRVDEIYKWIDMGLWKYGETGGYLRVCKEGRNWFETDFPNWLKEPPRRYIYEKRGKEHGSYIIESIETGRIYRGHFNVVNKGYISNLPSDCVVEVPGYVDTFGVHPTVIGDLPMGCAAACLSNITVQRLALYAAMNADIMLLRQAMMMDPLVGAVCDTNEIWQMTDEMLMAQEAWLPQYKEEISRAKIRWEQAALAGKLIAPIVTQGAARLQEKTIEQMASDKQAANRNASIADK